MRNAAATFDDDFGRAGASRKGASRPRPSGTKGKKKGRKGSAFALQGVARYAAIAMAATMALGIMVNALVLQKGHHPAPLFGKVASAGAAASPAPRPAAPAPVRAAVTEPQSAPVEAAPARSRKVEGAAHADPAPGNDAIGRLISGEAPAPGGHARTTDGKAGEKTVSAAQRALTKLGFKVPATGTLGPATRKAIEAFQKDRHLPVKGDLDRRMVKLLAAESGVKID